MKKSTVLRNVDILPHHYSSPLPRRLRIEFALKKEAARSSEFASYHITTRRTHFTLKKEAARSSETLESYHITARRTHFTLKKEAARSSEFASYHVTTRHHNPKDLDIKT
jgi:hypothetical protein